MKSFFPLLFPLLFLACGHDENGMEPEPTPVDPVPEVNPFDPVEEDGAPMKVMRLKKEDFMKLFVGKKWMEQPTMEINTKGNFINFLAVGTSTINLHAENENILVSEVLYGVYAPRFYTTEYNYNEETGCLTLLSERKLKVALINEECLILLEEAISDVYNGDFIVYTYKNKDEASVHQPQPRQDTGIFPFKTDALDKEAFATEMMSNFAWFPYITLGVYDDGTVALTNTSLPDTELYFGTDGMMREFFKDKQPDIWSVHKCPYTFDKKTAMLIYEKGRAPSIFKNFDDKVQVFSAFKLYDTFAMIALVVDTNGKSKYNKIVYILNSIPLSYAQEHDREAVEVDFDQ